MSEGARCFSRLEACLWIRFADLSLLLKSDGRWRWLCGASFLAGEGVLLLGPGSMSGNDEKEGGNEDAIVVVVNGCVEVAVLLATFAPHHDAPAHPRREQGRIYKTRKLHRTSIALTSTTTRLSFTHRARISSTSSIARMSPTASGCTRTRSTMSPSPPCVSASPSHDQTSSPLAPALENSVNPESSSSMSLPSTTSPSMRNTRYTCYSLHTHI